MRTTCLTLTLTLTGHCPAGSREAEGVAGSGMEGGTGEADSLR